MQVLQPLDWVALAVFLASWLAYSWLVDFSPWRERTLTAAMNRQRRLRRPLHNRSHAAKANRITMRLNNPQRHHWKKS